MEIKTRLSVFLQKMYRERGPWITWRMREMEMKKRREKRERVILHISSNPFSANYDQSPTWGFWPHACISSFNYSLFCLLLHLFA